MIPAKQCNKKYISGKNVDTKTNFGIKCFTMFYHIFDRCEEVSHRSKTPLQMIHVIRTNPLNGHQSAQTDNEVQYLECLFVKDLLVLHAM